MQHVQHVNVILETRGSAAWLRLNRPTELNALSRDMVLELGEALECIRRDEKLRVVVLTGSGRAFCAGADLKAVQAGLSKERSEDGDFLDAVAEVFQILRDFPKPVIGGLNGVTVAGGLELAMCCDVLIAAESAKIGDAHANFGVFPGAGGAAVLPSRIGLPNAKYLLFSGRSLPARDWLRMGLVQEVVADDALEARLDTFASDLADKSPLVLSRMKAVANASVDMSQAEALVWELSVLRDHLTSNDAAEGLAAFSEKRKPVFAGN